MRTLSWALFKMFCEKIMWFRNGAGRVVCLVTIKYVTGFSVSYGFLEVMW